MLPGSRGSASSGLDGDAGSGDESDSAIARAKIDVNSSMSMVPTAFGFVDGPATSSPSSCAPSRSIR